MPIQHALIRTLAIAALLGLGIPSAQTAPTSFTVRSVVVMQDGQWHAMQTQDVSAAQCARFRLTNQAALRWFRRARDVTEHAWREELDWTPCSAAGTLVTGDGRSLPWQLDQAGRAQVTLSPTVSVYLGGPELPFRR